MDATPRRRDRPSVTFALNQNNNDPDAWRKLLSFSAEAAAEGAPISPQVHGRTVSLLLGLQTFHPFNFCPTWASIGLYPWDEQAVRMRDDASLRERLVTEAVGLEGDPIVSGFMHPSRIFVLGDPPDYEPPPSRSVAAIAAAEGRTQWEVLYDLLLVDGGRELLNAPILNYTEGNLDAAREMLLHPTSAFGLGDGGARRPDVRCQHDHVHAQLLGPRSEARSHPARDRGAQDHRRDRRAVRAQRSRRGRAGEEGRRQRHRLRAVATPPARVGLGSPRRRVAVDPAFRRLHRHDQRGARDHRSRGRHGRAPGRAVARRPLILAPDG